MSQVSSQYTQSDFFEKAKFDEEFRLFQRDLARHCAPTILGVKPASLMMTKRSADCCRRLFAHLERTFKERGLSYKVVETKAANRSAVVVYREVFLKATLTKTKVKEALEAFAYDSGDSMESLLDQVLTKLKNRDGNSAFPHEIGLFLGYPPSDVLMFAKKPQTGCLLSGYFKVYSEADKAKLIFRAYAGCYSWLTHFLDSGRSLADLRHFSHGCSECVLAKEIVKSRLVASNEAVSLKSYN